MQNRWVFINIVAHTYRDCVLSVHFGKIQRRNKYKFILMKKICFFLSTYFNVPVQLGGNIERQSYILLKMNILILPHYSIILNRFPFPWKITVNLILITCNFRALLS